MYNALSKLPHFEHKYAWQVSNISHTHTFIKCNLNKLQINQHSIFIVRKTALLGPLLYLIYVNDICKACDHKIPHITG